MKKNLISVVILALVKRQEIMYPYKDEMNFLTLFLSK